MGSTFFILFVFSSDSLNPIPIGDGAAINANKSRIPIINEKTIFDFDLNQQ